MMVVHVIVDGDVGVSLVGVMLVIVVYQVVVIVK